MTSDELLQQVRDLLGEHALSFIVAFEIPEDGDDGRNQMVRTWGGSFTQACGLTERLRNDLRRDDERIQEEVDDDDDWKQGAEA